MGEAFALIAHWYMCLEGLLHLVITCAALTCFLWHGRRAHWLYRRSLLAEIILMDAFYTVYMNGGLYWCCSHWEACFPGGTKQEQSFAAGVRYGVFAASMVWLQNLSVLIDVIA